LRGGPLCRGGKAWRGEVGKEAVIVFLAKILDFMAAASFEPLTPIFAGFIALTTFSDAVLRIMFTCGLIPLTKSSDQLEPVMNFE
jgi:hypothetical protein